MKQNMQSYLMILLIFFGSATLIAQSNTTAAGGDATSSDGSVSYSLGQIDYIEASGSGGTANQGVQQPFEFFVLGNDEFEQIELVAKVYPNPTSDFIILKVTDLSFEKLNFQLYDLSGRLILTNRITSEETTIPMASLASATYYLAVFNQNTLLKTFKIIKN